MARARDIFLIQDELSGHYVCSSKYGSFSDISNAALFYSEVNATKAMKEILGRFLEIYGTCSFSDGIFSEHWYPSKEYYDKAAISLRESPEMYEEKKDYFLEKHSGRKLMVKELKLRVVPCKVVPQLS